MSTYDVIKARTNSAVKRYFLDCVGPNWYVETAPDATGRVQGGDVADVIRDRFHVPVCIKVELRQRDDAQRKRYDYISVERIVFFEPYDSYISDYSDYEDIDKVLDDIDAYATSLGYVYDDTDCCWRHPETGDEICY